MANRTLNEDITSTIAHAEKILRYERRRRMLNFFSMDPNSSQEDEGSDLDDESTNESQSQRSSEGEDVGSVLGSLSGRDPDSENSEDNDIAREDLDANRTRLTLSPGERKLIKKLRSRGTRRMKVYVRSLREDNEMRMQKEWMLRRVAALRQSGIENGESSSSPESNAEKIYRTIFVESGERLTYMMRQ